MTDNKVEISLLTSNKSGILSSIMIRGHRLGLMHNRHHVEQKDDNQSRMVIIFEGSLNCSKDKLIESLESHPEIHSIESISIGDSVANTTIPQISSNSSFAPLRAHYIITPESLQIAEQKLLGLLGPSAHQIVRSAADKTKHIGDLYLLLSKHLNGEERTKFLALVSDMDLDQIK